VVVSRDLLLFVNSLVESSRVECTPTILISNIPGNVIFFPNQPNWFLLGFNTLLQNNK
jgi:hypothetical protein